MLRAFVLVLLVVNAALFAWLQSNPNALQPDREPQRLERQVSPDAIQVLPDLPTSAPRGAKAASQAASTVATAASGADANVAAASAPNAGAFAHKTSDAEIDCSETPPIDGALFGTLKTALIKAGVPPDAIGERRQSQGGTWLVYLGRYADPLAWQQKVDEMKKLDVKYERVNNPAALAPGLSLGQFSSQPDAAKRLDEVTRRGVKGAKVVAATPPIILLHLQVHATDPAWRHATAGQRFNSCPVDAPSST